MVCTENVGHEEAAKDFLKNTFASNVDLMNQLAVDITLVSTMNAAADAENYKKGNDFSAVRRFLQILQSGQRMCRL